jgi:hypothetical protein
MTPPRKVPVVITTVFAHNVYIVLRSRHEHAQLT